MVDTVRYGSLQFNIIVKNFTVIIFWPGGCKCSGGKEGYQPPAELHDSHVTTSISILLTADASQWAIIVIISHVSLQP